jgi:transposase
VVRAKNRLKSVFLSRGIEVDAGVYEATGRSKWLPKLPRPHRDLAEWLGQQLDGLLPLRETAEEWLRREAKTHPIIRTLSTAPGMGIIRSAQTVAVVAIPDRFRTSRQFWSGRRKRWCLAADLCVQRTSSGAIVARHEDTGSRVFVLRP